MLNTYKIMMLGSSNSGKTVLLASMYKYLLIQDEATFFLEVESLGQHKELTDKYYQLEDTTKPFPAGSKGLSEWIFTCCVSNADVYKHKACKFVYLDYAGGILTEGGETNALATDALEKHIKEANTFLGLLDGQTLLSYMRGEKAGSKLISKDLPNILPHIQRLDKDNPVHFVVNKWDLLEEHFSLEEIRDRLFEIKDFKALVQARLRAGSQVRLIPVSAVGKGFAELQFDGKMKKVQGKILQPFQVEMPLACVLPAAFRFELAKLAAKREEIQNQKVDAKANTNFLDQIFIMLADGIEALYKLLPREYQVGDRLIQRIITNLENSVQEDPEKAKRQAEEQRTKNLKEVQSQETAFQHIIQSFLDLERELDNRFPASNLKIKDFY